MPMMKNTQQINYTTIIDPYVVETLKTIIGRTVLVETVRGSLQGILVEVKPDHVVVKTHGTDSVFYIRLQQIIYVMPITP